MLQYESIRIDDELSLVQLYPDSADQLFHLTMDNKDYLAEFLPWAANMKRVADSLRHIEKTLAERSAGNTYTYGVMFDGKLVGDAMIRGLKSDPEIGYWIAKDYSGRGIITKAAGALTDLALDDLGVDSVTIKARSDNIASNRVAAKLGYKLIDTEIRNEDLLNIWAKSR